MLVVVVSHVFLHSLSPYFICLNTSVQYVHSVYLCLSVILSINIKNTTKHVLFVILCLSVILSINIKNTTKHVYSGIICLSIILSLYINFPFSMYVSFISVTNMKSRCCRLRWRRALSSIKKGVFLDVKGHVLEWRRVCSWKEWGSGVRLLWLQGSVLSVDLMSLWAFVCSVHLCFSVRKRTHPPCEKERLRFAGEFFLSQSTQSSRSFLAHSFEPTEGLRHTEFTERYCQRWL